MGDIFLLIFLYSFLPSSLSHFYSHGLVYFLAHNQGSAIICGKMHEWSQCWNVFSDQTPNRKRCFFPRRGTNVPCHRSMQMTQWGRMLSSIPSRQTEKLFLGRKVISTHLAECVGRRSVLEGANILRRTLGKHSGFRAENKQGPMADSH